MSDSICPKCSLPEVEDSSGSLTGWMSGCRCALAEKEGELYLTLKVCKICRKRISLDRHGSFTQWIFRSDLCNCDSPRIGPDDPGIETGNKVVESGEIQESVIDYPELEDLEGDFPSQRYKPIEIIGSGAHSVVYRSQDRLLNKIVAVKVLHNVSSEAVVSFQDEARIISKLKHENIIEVIDINVTVGGTPYMVLEYVLGTSLASYLLENGALPLHTALDFFNQILAGLQYAHDKGILHRDLKPANVLVAKGIDDVCLVKLIDFGIALVASEPGNQSDSWEGIAGTPAYMPPDQAGGHTYDRRSDLYSMGCIMFEVLTGRPAFYGDTTLELLGKQVRDEPPLLFDYVDKADYPPELEGIVSRCLSRFPSQRFDSAEKLREELNGLREADRLPQVEKVEKQQNRTRQEVIIGGLALLIGFVCLGNLIVVLTHHDGSVKDIDAVFKGENERPTIFLDSKITVGDLGTFLEKGNGYVIGGKLVDDNSLKALSGRRDIHMLNLSHTLVGGSGFKYLVGMPLTSLVLNTTDIGDDELETLARATPLEELDLLNTRVEGRNLDQFKALRVLNVAYTSVDDPGFNSIGRLENLRSLMMSCDRISDEAFANLVENSKISELRIYGDKLPESFFDSVSKMPHLNNLGFDERIVSEEEVYRISKLDLEQFNLNNCRFEGKAFSRLSSLKNLQGLHFVDMSVPRSDLAKLKRALPNCSISASARDASPTTMFREEAKQGPVNFEKY